MDYSFLVVMIVLSTDDKTLGGEHIWLFMYVYSVSETTRENQIARTQKTVTFNLFVEFVIYV